MRRLAAAVRWDATLQARHGFYAVTAVVVLVWVGILRLLPPVTRADPAALAPAFVVGNLQVTAFYFATALVFLERSQRALQALLASPLRPGEYLAAKALSLTLLATAENALLLVLVYGFRFEWGWLLLGTAALSGIYVLLGLGIVARYPTFSGFLMPSVVYTFALTLPLLSYYGVVPAWLFAWHPVAPPLALLRAGCEPVSLGVLAYGFLGSAVWLALAAWWARRRLLRHLAPAVA